MIDLFKLNKNNNVLLLWIWSFQLTDPPAPEKRPGKSKKNDMWWHNFSIYIFRGGRCQTQAWSLPRSDSFIEIALAKARPRPSLAVEPGDYRIICGQWQHHSQTRRCRILAMMLAKGKAMSIEVALTDAIRRTLEVALAKAGPQKQLWLSILGLFVSWTT